MSGIKRPAALCMQHKTQLWLKQLTQPTAELLSTRGIFEVQAARKEAF